VFDTTANARPPHRRRGTLRWPRLKVVTVFRTPRCLLSRQAHRSTGGRPDDRAHSTRRASRARSIGILRSCLRCHDDPWIRDWIPGACARSGSWCSARSASHRWTTPVSPRRRDEPRVPVAVDVPPGELSLRARRSGSPSMRGAQRCAEAADLVGEGEYEPRRNATECLVAIRLRRWSPRRSESRCDGAPRREARRQASRLLAPLSPRASAR